MPDEIVLGGVCMTAIKAIRAYCIECSGGNKNEVRLCNLKDCPLYPYRLGKNPNYVKRTMSEEQKKAMAKRLEAARKVREQMVK